MRVNCSLRLLALVVSMGFAGRLHGQAPVVQSIDSRSVTNVIPTTTKETGDMGGKFFGKIPDPAKTKHYYIAAEPELWNFAPDGQDPVCGKTLPAELLLNRVSWKIRYVQYADANFTARILPEERLGIMGPVLRGVTGDYIAVTLLNRSWLPVSMHPHGVRYDKDSEGSYYKPNPGRGAAIAPGASFTYVWQIDEGASPRPNEPSSKAWLYHSHVAGDEETNLGLVGLIIATDSARARADGTPNDVDREMAVMFKIFDESTMSVEAEEEPDERPANAPPTGPVQRTWAELQEIMERAERHTINGLTFGNLHGLEMREGERVRWYTIGLGSEKDFHTAHWHANRLVEENRATTDSVELLPGSTKVADMKADVAGDWLLHCHVSEHMSEGMFARFKVFARDEKGVRDDAEGKFFGLPKSFQTLQIKTAEFEAIRNGKGPELYLNGQVSVPDPFPVARNAFTVRIGGRAVIFTPDASGLASSDEGYLLVKNLSPYGNGNVRGGTLQFEVSLKGAKASTKKLKIELGVGPAEHSTEVVVTEALPVTS